MFKNAIVYRIDRWAPPTQSEIENQLDQGRFIECGATQSDSAGWVEPRGEAHAPLLESVAGQLILKLCQESRRVPGAVVRTQLEQKLAQAEQATGRRPKGKAALEMKDEIVHSLLPRAFPRRSSTWVWLDLDQRLAVIGAGSAKRADTVVTRLLELLGPGVGLSALQTQLSPAVAMATWLAEREAPAGFSIDRECELKQPDGQKATVRYARHTLDIDEVGEHIRQGKTPTQLALTWRSRVSFVLGETGVLKKLKLLDVVLEGAGDAGAKGRDSGFDTDVALATGELRGLLPELIEALGGAEPAPLAAAA